MIPKIFQADHADITDKSFLRIYVLSESEGVVLSSVYGVSEPSKSERNSFCGLSSFAEETARAEEATNRTVSTA
jgi:hypothetical protein